jgi:hypothetical protein
MAIDSGIDELLRQADRNAQARRAAAAAPKPAPVAPAAPSPATAVAAAPKPGALARVGGLARGAGTALAPAAATSASIDAFSRPTEDYYNRFGMDPKGANLNGFKDLAVRTGGVVSDVGAGILDVGTGVVNGIRTFGGAEPIQTFGEIVRRNDNPQPRPAPQPAAQPAQAAQAAQPQQPAVAPNDPAAQPGGGSQMFRKGNEFSDQPIAGGVEYKARGNVSVMNTSEGANRDRAYLAQREAENNEQMARRDASIDATINAAKQYRSQQQMQDAARSAEINATSLVHKDLWPRHRAALLEQANNMKGAAAVAAGAPTPTATRTPEQEAALAASKRTAGAQAQLADEQAIAAGLQNDQARRSQQVMQQLDGLSEQTPAPQRRALIDRALVGQGKDPDAGRYMGIDTILGYDEFGQPKTGKTALDTRTGQIIGGQGGAGAMGNQPQKPQYEEGKVYEDANGNRVRIVNGQKVPL